MDHHSHHHLHEHHHGCNKSASKNIGIAFFVNFGFAIFELVGGILINSVAILSDAVHDLGDSLTLGAAYFLERYSQRQSDQVFSYGYRRLSLLSAAFTASILIIGSGIVLFIAVPRLIYPVEPYGPGMIVFAIVGILVNGWAAYRVSRGQSLNEKLISWHLLEDVLGWVAVFIGAVLITFLGWTWIDPLLSIVFAVFISYRVWIQLKKITMIFLQTVPSPEFTRKLTHDLLAFHDKIKGVHDLHIWSLDGQSHVGSLHLVMTENLDLIYCEKLKREIKKHLEAKYKIHLTIEIEFNSPETEPCEAEDCGDKS